MALVLQVVLLALVLTAWVFLGYLRRAWHWRRVVKGMPAPPTYPLIGCVLSMAVHPDKLADCVIGLCRRFGDNMQLWLGPSLLCTLHKAEDVEMFCNSPALADKSWHYDMFKPVLGDGLITINNPQHRVHRKLVSNSMHLDILKGFVNVFSERSGDLVHQLHELHDQKGSGVVDLSPCLARGVVHTLCDTVLSTDSSSMEGLRDELIHASGQASGLYVWRLTKPWFWSERVFRLFSPRFKEYQLMVHGMQKFVHKVFTSKKEAVSKGVVLDSKRRAFLDHVLASEERGVLSEFEIKEELRTLIWAGSTTTVDALSFFFIALSLLPDIQAKIHEEVDAVFGPHRDRPVEFSDLSHLQYVERCIKESLRLFPPVPLLARHVAEDVALPSGYTLPKDATAFTSPYIVHRNPQWFPDPERFDPDRFLPDNCTGRHPYSYIPFSAGSRNCVGQRFALMSMKIIVTRVFLHFAVLPDPDGPQRLEDIPLTLGLSMGPTNGSRVRLVPRPRAAAC